MKIVTTHTINGRNIKDMSKDELIGVIRASEADVATLESMETESEAVTKEVKSIRAFIADVVSHLDKKV